MRFLIVDDDQGKVEVIRDFLIENGVDRNDVVSAEHAAGARICLGQAPFDVLLIDVLLPARSGALPSGDHSVELLRQIVDDGTTRAPRYILGVTASSATIDTFDGEFKSLVTQILHIAPGEDAWRESVSALLKLMQRVDAAEEASDYDICILNALRSPELEAVYESWPLKLDSESLLQRNIRYRTGTVSLGSVPRRIVCAHLSQVGPVAAAHAATALISEFRPRVLLMTGICGGFSDHVSVGDIVVAEKSWDWQAGKWTDAGTLTTSSDQRDAAAELIAEAREIESTLLGLHDSYVGVRPEVAPRLVIGPMVTGSSVIASLDIQKVFRTQHRKMVGVDMECYGLYYAAENHSGQPVRAICIKSVSDLADRTKGDDFQKYCAHMSAVAALEVLRRYFR